MVSVTIDPHGRPSKVATKKYIRLLTEFHDSGVIVQLARVTQCGETGPHDGGMLTQPSQLQLIQVFRGSCKVRESTDV